MPHPHTITEICAALEKQGQPDLAQRIAYFASDEDLEEGDVPVTLESALGFWEFLNAVYYNGYVGSGCSSEGWICAEWKFEDKAGASIWFLDNKSIMFALRGNDGMFIRINDDDKCLQRELLSKLSELGLVTAQESPLTP